MQNIIKILSSVTFVNMSLYNKNDKKIEMLKTLKMSQK